MELLIELFAPEGDETTPVFGKKDSSGQVTTCGVGHLKGKTILLDLRSDDFFDDISLQSLKQMYDDVGKDKLDLEIISIPILRQNRPTYKSRRVGRYKRHKQVPWFVFQSGTRFVFQSGTWAITKVAQFFFTEQCGLLEDDECEKW